MKWQRMRACVRVCVCACVSADPAREMLGSTAIGFLPPQLGAAQLGASLTGPPAAQTDTPLAPPSISLTAPATQTDMPLAPPSISLTAPANQTGTPLAPPGIWHAGLAALLLQPPSPASGPAGPGLQQGLCAPSPGGPAGS